MVHSTAIVPTSSSYFPHFRSNFDWIFQLPLTFLISIVVFQLHWFFPSSFKTFQLLQSLSNFICTFQPQPEISNFNLSNFISDFPASRFFQLSFPTTRIPKENIKCHQTTFTYNQTAFNSHIFYKIENTSLSTVSVLWLLEPFMSVLWTF